MAERRRFGLRVELEPFLGQTDRLLEVLIHVKVGLGQEEISPGKALFCLDRLLELIDLLLELPRLPVEQGEVEVGRVGAGMDFYLFPVFLHRPPQVSSLLIEEPQVVMGVGDALPHFQSLEDLLLGPLQHLFFQEDGAQIVMGKRAMIGVDRDRLLKMGHRLVKILGIEVDLSQVDMGLGIPGVELDGPLETGDRLFVFS